MKEGQNSDLVKALTAALESKDVANFVAAEYDGAGVSVMDPQTVMILPLITTFVAIRHKPEAPLGGSFFLKPLGFRKNPYQA